MFGPLESLDDVRHTLGAWLLSEEKLTAADVKRMVEGARELAKYVECNLRLRELTDRGFAVSYFSPQLRAEIRAELDKMDLISAGSEVTLQRRNETLARKIA